MYQILILKLSKMSHFVQPGHLTKEKVELQHLAAMKNMKLPSCCRLQQPQLTRGQFDQNILY